MLQNEIKIKQSCMLLTALTHSHNHSLAHSLTLTHSLTHSHTLSLTHTLTCSLTLPLTHSIHELKYETLCNQPTAQGMSSQTPIYQT